MFSIMCGLIFHKDPGFCFTLKNPKEIPHALDRFYEWYVTLLLKGGERGSSDYYRAY